MAGIIIVARTGQRIVGSQTLPLIKGEQAVTLLKFASHKIFCTAILILALPLFVSAQAQDRILDWYQGKSVPEVKVLEIIEIKVEGKTVAIGQPFMASKDWLKSLTFKVRSVSGKPIKVFNLGITIPEIKSNGRSIILGMPYGIGGMGVSQGGSDVSKPVRSGEEVDLVIPKLLLEYLQKHLAKHNVPGGVNHVSIYPEVILTYEDGSSECGGFLNH